MPEEYNIIVLFHEQLFLLLLLLLIFIQVDVFGSHVYKAEIREQCSPSLYGNCVSQEDKYIRNISICCGHCLGTFAHIRKDRCPLCDHLQTNAFNCLS